MLPIDPDHDLVKLLLPRSPTGYGGPNLSRVFPPDGPPALSDHSISYGRNLCWAVSPSYTRQPVLPDYPRNPDRGSHSTVYGLRSHGQDTYRGNHPSVAQLIMSVGFGSRATTCSV